MAKKLKFDGPVKNELVALAKMHTLLGKGEYTKEIATGGVLKFKKNGVVVALFDPAENWLAVL